MQEQFQIQIPKDSIKVDVKHIVKEVGHGNDEARLSDF